MRFAALALVLVLPACIPSRPPPKPRTAPPKVERRCDLTGGPVEREQALCVARAAEPGHFVEGTYAIEPGTDLEREPIWILREDCARAPGCLELWIRRADGAIVNTRYLHAFEDYDRLDDR